MSRLLRRLVSGYNYVFHELGDPRVENFMFMSSPIPLALILSFYLYFVLKLGPSLMKNRPPFNLDKVLIVYNLIQIVASGYFVVVVFIILRKKDNQASFLHIYHHTGMIILGWIGTKYLAGGHGVFMGFVNSLVHCVMYFYYLLSTCNKEYKKSIWWKKHITQLQMLQFLILIIYFGQILLQPDCPYPKWVAWTFIPQNVFMLILFSDFYIKAYIKPEQRHAPPSLQTKQGTEDVNTSKSD